MGNRRYFSLCISVTAIALVMSCSRKPGETAASPTSPTAIAAIEGNSGGVSGPSLVPMPARNDTVDFRRQLESKYANDLRRPASQVFVDHEGDAAWIGEYVRYRTNGCDHNTAVQRTMEQIDGASAGPVCSVLQFPENAIYPPREHLVDFRRQLGAKYQSMGRSFSSSVDPDGSGIWVGEYLRYRSSGCDHASAVQKTLTQIDGNPPPPSCVVACAYTFSPVTATIPSAGGFFGTTAIRTSGSCEWIAGSEVDWITVNRPITGGDRSPLTFTVQQNTTPNSRAGSIRVVYAGGTSYFNIAQQPAGDSLAFVMFDPAQSATLPTSECQVRTTGTVCTLAATDGGRPAPSGRYEWTVEYTYNGSKLRTQAGALPTFSFTETCSAVGITGGAVIPMKVKLVATVNGVTSVLTSGEGSQVPLQLRAFPCP